MESLIIHRCTSPLDPVLEMHQNNSGVSGIASQAKRGRVQASVQWPDARHVRWGWIEGTGVVLGRWTASDYFRRSIYNLFIVFLKTRREATDASLGVPYLAAETDNGFIDVQDE